MNIQECDSTSGQCRAVNPHQQRMVNTNEAAKMQARREFLAHIPPTTHEYRYDTLSSPEEVIDKEYTELLEHDGSPYIIFTNVSQEASEEFPGRVDYSPPLKILVLTMVTLPHEQGARFFNLMIGDKAKEMNIRRTISFRGATPSKTPDREKQPDSSFGPRQLSPGRTAKWPTVAVEVGFLETKPKLKSDAAYWLNSSAGEVLTVITVDIKASGDIYIVLWKRGLVTDQRPNPETGAIQEIKITRGKDGQAASLVGGELRITFHNLMLGNPGEGEGDFVITRDELLHDMADQIWWAMDHK